MSSKKESSHRPHNLNASFESEKELLNQRYASYSTTIEEIRARLKSEEEQTRLQFIDGLMAQPKSWINISTVQQSLVALMTEDEIDIDFKVRLIKAKDLLPFELQRFYNENYKTSNSSKRKELLERLITDTQWYSKIHDLEKSYVSKTRIRTGVLFLVSIILFFAVDQIQWLSDLLGITKGDKGDAILIAVSSGVLGTCFSMIIGLKTRLHMSTISDLRVLHRFDYITSRALIGFVSGLILFYFFDSELIQAPLFPSFNHNGLSTEFLNHENLALLVVWSFVSGFSEKLVPDLLFKAEKSLESEISFGEDNLAEKQ